MIMPYLFLVLAQFMVGIIIVSTKYLTPYFPSMSLLAIRFTLSTLLLLALHSITTSARETLRNLKDINKKDWSLIILQGLCAGLFFNVLILWGLHYTSANVAGIITSVLPALIALLSWVILKQQFSAQKGLCVLFASIGLIIIGFNELKGTAIHHSMFGNILIMGALLPEAAYYILSKLYPNRLPVFLISAILNGVNAICLFPFLVLHFNFNLLRIPIFAWFILLVLSISTGFFYVFWYRGSHEVDAIAASLSTALMPIATVVVAWLTLGEFINGMQLIGMFFVMMSIVVYTFSWGRKD